MITQTPPRPAAAAASASLSSVEILLRDQVARPLDQGDQQADASRGAQVQQLLQNAAILSNGYKRSRLVAGQWALRSALFRIPTNRNVVRARSRFGANGASRVVQLDTI